MPSGLLERMRRNPAADWQIRDVEAVCRAYGCIVSSREGNVPLSCEASIRSRNIDHSGAPPHQAGLHPQARALY